MPGPSSKARPLLLGHRGARAVRSIPENSMESFERALADGCDGFEFDVRLTADGVAVVCHDPSYKGLEIARVSAEQLPGLARLEEVLRRFHERAFLDIELKVEGIEKTTLEMLRKYPPQRGHVVSSFLERVLSTFRQEDKSVPLGLICETRAELTQWRDVPCQYVIPHHSLITETLVAELRGSEKMILVWTVNNKRQMMRLRDSGVDGIISDDTASLYRTLGDVRSS